jgi:hypothetical protein
MLKFIQRLKNELKKDDVMQKICDDFDADIEDIDLIPVRFAPIDTSAKTDAGIVTLNSDLLTKESLDKVLSLMLHEFYHYFSQCDEPTQSADDGDYLSNKDEVEAFQHQIQYLDENAGESAAEEYVEQVLDHHDEEGKERDRKKTKLMKLVE